MTERGGIVKISTKGRYALRLMAELAHSQGDACLPMKTISEHQGISEKYLEQIIRPLAKAGLVVGTRGPHGGYRLTREPQAITVGEVLRLTEGDLAPVDCVSDASESACAKADNCETMFVWRKMKEAVDQVVDSISVAELSAASCSAVDETVKRIQTLS